MPSAPIGLDQAAAAARAGDATVNALPFQAEPPEGADKIAAGKSLHHHGLEEDA